jgi:hypothetical protein
MLWIYKWLNFICMFLKTWIPKQRITSSITWWEDRVNIIDSVCRSFPWDSNSNSIKKPRILWNSKLITVLTGACHWILYFEQDPHGVTTQKTPFFKMNPVYNILPNFIYIRASIISLSTFSVFPNWYLPSWLPTKLAYIFLIFFALCLAVTSSLSLILWLE